MFSRHVSRHLLEVLFVDFVEGGRGGSLTAVFRAAGTYRRRPIVLPEAHATTAHRRVGDDNRVFAIFSLLVAVVTHSPAATGTVNITYCVCRTRSAYGNISLLCTCMVHTSNLDCTLISAASLFTMRKKNSLVGYTC